MKSLLFIVLSACLFGCGSVKEGESSVHTTQENKNIIEIEAKIGKANKDSDPLKITAVKIKGNTLILNVEYGGGCKDHEFELVGDAAIMKSLPPKRGIYLNHKANQDNCKAIVFKELHIDITELAVTETSGSEIILILNGWDEEINYVFE